MGNQYLALHSFLACLSAYFAVYENVNRRALMEASGRQRCLCLVVHVCFLVRCGLLKKSG
jgi:hypothetical protein